MACANSTCRIARTVTRYSSRLTPNPFVNVQQQQAPLTNWGGESFNNDYNNDYPIPTRSRKSYRKTPLLEAGTMTRAQLAPTAIVKTQSRPITIRRAKSLGAGILTLARQYTPTNFYNEAPVGRVITQRGRKALGKSMANLVQPSPVYNTVSPVNYGNTGAFSRYSPSTYGQGQYQNDVSVAYQPSPAIPYNAGQPGEPGYNYNPSPVSIRSPTIRRSTANWNNQGVVQYSPQAYDLPIQSRVQSNRVRLASGSPSIIPTSTRVSRRGLSLAAPRATEYTKDNLPPLPPVNSSCCGNFAIPPARSTRENVQLPSENRVINLYDNDVKTVVRDVNRYKTFLKTVVTNVNRNHVHTNRVVENQNNHNIYLTQNVIKVNDIHRQRVQRVPGEVKNFNSQKQTQRIEPAVCGGCQNEQY